MTLVTVGGVIRRQTGELTGRFSEQPVKATGALLARCWEGHSLLSIAWLALGEILELTAEKIEEA